MTIRAVLFDLDGTLVDSLEDLTAAVNHIRGVFGHLPLSSDVVRRKVGKGARNLVQQVLPDATDANIERALDLFLDFNRLHIADKSRLYPGIAEVLRTLAERDITMAVISNKNEELSRMILEVLGIGGLFASVSGGDTYPERKPSPLPVLAEIEKLGFALYECVIAGDSINDIEAGRLAGIATIACTWGYGGADELTGADAFARTPQEMLALIAPGSDTHS